MIQDFPFEDDASRANAIALLLTPILRHTFEGCVPLALIDAPQEGTGKSLFTDLVSFIATGRNAPKRVAPYQDDEWRKLITAELVAGATFVVFDNLESVLKSAALASAITSSIWSDRILGKSENIQVPQRAIFVVTGNNVQLGGDFNRRCFWIRLNARMSQPWRGREFKHPNLLGWVAENRGRLITALLTLVRHWWVIGCPQPATARLGSFEDWCRIVGGVLEATGVTGFLGNVDQLLERADQDRAEWQVFLEWLLKKTTLNSSFSVKEVVNWIIDSEDLDEGPSGAEVLPGKLAEKWNPDRPHAFSTALGQAFKRSVETRYGPEGIHLRAEQPLSGTGQVARYSITYVDAPTRGDLET